MQYNKTFARTIKTFAFLGVAALGAADAHAGFSNVNAPVHATEQNHAQILGQTYGGTFSASGANYSNGSGGVAAQRMDDDAFGSVITDLLAGSGGNSDQCWGNATISARAIARYSGGTQSFGLINGASGGSFQELFTVSGFGTNVTGSAADVDLSGTTFRFARGGDGELMSSLPDDNSGGADQMVSYKILGAGGLAKYVLFFEDVGVDAGDGDWDFNDLVVEITATPGVNAIPLPPAAWAGLITLGGTGLWNARKKLRGLIA